MALRNQRKTSNSGKSFYQLAPGKSAVLRLDEGETGRSVTLYLNRGAKERDWKLVFKMTDDGTMDFRLSVRAFSRPISRFYLATLPSISATALRSITRYAENLDERSPFWDV